jgi:hypothetical protein
MRGCLAACAKVFAIVIILLIGISWLSSRRDRDGASGPAIRQPKETDSSGNQGYEAQAAAKMLIEKVLDPVDPEFPFLDMDSGVAYNPPDDAWITFGKMTTLSGIGNGRNNNEFKAIVKGDAHDGWRLIRLDVDGEQVR